MVEICNDLLVEELWNLKSKTCNTMWAKLNGCKDCKFCLNVKNEDNQRHVTVCLVTIMATTIQEPDKRKIKGVF